MKDFIKKIIIYSIIYLLLLYIKHELGFEYAILSGITLCISIIIEKNIKDEK